MKVWIEGTARQNEDGTARGDLIRALADGESLRLMRMALAFDPNAVAVTNADGKILGFLPSDAARAAAIRMEAKGNASVTATARETREEEGAATVALAVEIDVEAARPTPSATTRSVETSGEGEAEGPAKDKTERDSRGKPKPSDKQRIVTGLTIITLVLIYFVYKYFIKK